MPQIGGPAKLATGKVYFQGKPLREREHTEDEY